MARVAYALAMAAVWAAAGPVQAQPADSAPPPTPSPADAPAEAAPAPAEATPEGAPPPGYYSEPPASPAEPRRAAQPAAAPGQPPRAAPRPQPGQAVYEPAPPGVTYQPVYEPPPPPKPKHVAPKTAFWLGARGGWFLPFGSLWDEYVGRDAYGYAVVDRVPMSDYASSGVMFELDVGMRLGRRYNLFLFWEHAELGGGKDNPQLMPATHPDGEASSGADSDYYALALRFSSDPDQVGFLTEFALGYRRMRIEWDDGTELQLTNAPFEFRLGLGADIRLSPAFSLSPLFTIGFGGFGDGEFVYPDGSSATAIRSTDVRDAHGWLTLQLGAHFDIG